MTVEEYQAGRVVKNVYTVRVHSHKTAKTGSAVIMFDDQLKKRADKYMLYARPLIACNAVAGNEGVFFLTISGQKIANISQRMTTIGNHVGFTVYPPSQVRRTWATYAAKNLKEDERQSMTKQMRHSIEHGPIIRTGGRHI